MSDRPRKTDLGERVTRLRLAREWSQEELARRSGLGLMAINRIETGEVKQPKLASLRGIARAFGMPLDELAPEEEPATPRGAA